MSLAFQFGRFVIPSMLAFALSGVYAIADGFFVGNALGDSALAAINIAYPLTALLQALGSGIGMGGAVGYAIAKGQDDFKRSDEFYSITIVILVIASLILIPLCFLISPAVIKAFGADGAIYDQALEYIRYITIGAFFQIMATGMVPFIRNMGLSSAATLSMVAGFFTNIILDYLMVWRLGWGMAGAAIASVIGQGVTFIVCIAAAVKRKQKLTLKFSKNLRLHISSIIMVGIAPFGLVLSPNISLVFMNKFLSLFGGSFAVTCFAVISYITTIVLLVMQGIGDGSQPLFSLYFGKGEIKTIHTLRKMGLVFSFIVVILVSIALYILRYDIPILFGSSEEVVNEVAHLMPLFLLGLCCTPISRITIAYCYATEKTSRAYILVYGELVLLFLSLVILSATIGITGIWLSIPLSQLMISLVAVAILILQRCRS